MLFKTEMSFVETEDSDLVLASLRGDRDAFAEIVRRYQDLICSITYNATGSITESEDLAQETFLIAWRQLKSLSEPAKIRSWLCGIARNVVSNVVRRKERQVIDRSKTVDDLQNIPDGQNAIVDNIIRQEEEAILWRSIEKIPVDYREPLILFYRQGASIEQVAKGLEISEDAAKQRLSRGRKMLAEEVSAFVESALKRSGPGRAFTLGVIAALPVFATSATAATVGAGAAKGTAAATGLTFVSALGMLLGPAIGFAGGYAGHRASLKAARTPREREMIKRMGRHVLFGALLFNAALFACIYLTVHYWKHHPWLFVTVGVLIPVVYCIWIFVEVFRFNREFRTLREAELKAHPEMFEAALRAAKTGREYRSKATFLGLPLVHVCNGVRIENKTKPAVGWIAIGDKAYGGLFAVGGIAVGTFACGGLAFGGIACGGIALGSVAIGGLTIGAFAAGGTAGGIMAFGGIAAGIKAAFGGIAVAGSYAVGGQTIAPHANDAAARDYFKQFAWLFSQEHRQWLQVVLWSPLVLFLFPPFFRKKGRK